MAQRGYSGKAPKAVTLRHVAALAGVDPSVVSRVINDDPRLGIADETRERVIKAIRESNYRPNVMARGLRTARSYTIGLVLPNLSNPIYVGIVNGAQAAAVAAGYHLVLAGDVEQRNAERTFAEMLRGGRVDGLLFSSGSMHDSDLRALALDDAPIVLVNRLIDGVRSSVVVADDAAARLATEHVLGLGHRSVIAVTGPEDVDTSVRRSKGFLQAAREGGIAAPAVIHASGWEAAAGYQVARGIFDGGHTATAVVAMSLTLAIGVMKGCRDANLNVPEDVSVIGLHDHDLAQYLTPPLTTVQLPLEEMGSQAVTQLLRKLDGERVGALTVDTPPTLVQRGSTAAPA